MGDQIFNETDPIFPQSSKKELAAYSKLAELTSLVSGQVSQAESKSTKPTSLVPIAAYMPSVDSVHVFLCCSYRCSEPSRDQDDFAPWSAIFQKPADSVNHLKPLHVKGHINGRPINNMLVDNGAMVNLMSYSLYKKFGGSDEELIKTKRMVKGVGGGKPILAKGFALMKLAIGSKTLATVFFIVEVQGSYRFLGANGFMATDV
jgi:hypothetical protein